MEERPRVELAVSRSQGGRPNHYTTEALYTSELGADWNESNKKCGLNTDAISDVHVDVARSTSVDVSQL